LTKGYTMSKQINKNLIACVPDIHVPKHDPAAVRWCLERIREERPKTVVLIGDVFDYEAISRFTRKLTVQAAFQEEVKAGRRMVKRIQDACGYGADVHFIAGNHESRLAKYAIRNCPHIADLPGLALPQVMEFPQDWHYYPYNLNALSFDGVLCLHGRRFAGNVCSNNIKKYHCSVIQGHSHRASTAYLRSPDGRTIGAVEAGCLCNLTPNYAADVDWVHAMAWIQDKTPLLELK
jgi:predicted phosphodiesterase